MEKEEKELVNADDAADTDFVSADVDIASADNAVDAGDDADVNADDADDIASADDADGSYLLYVLDKNMPTAKLDENGNIFLERPAAFAEDMKGVLDMHTAEIKRRSFRVAACAALGIAVSAVWAAIDPSMDPVADLTFKAFIIGGTPYLLDPVFSRLYISDFLKNHDKKAQEYLQEEYEKGNHIEVLEDGTVVFDNPALKQGPSFAEVEAPEPDEGGSEPPQLADAR